MPYKVVSSEYVIQRVLQNHQIENANWTKDAYDWIGSCIRLINKNVGFRKKIVQVEVADHKAEYPCDLESLLGIEYEGAMLPLGSDRSGIGMVTKFKQSATNTNKNIFDENDLLELSLLQTQLEDLIAEYAITPTTELAENIQNTTIEINKMESTMATFSQYYYGQSNLRHADFYDAELDYIRTSFETGTISFIYYAYPTDKNGYPMVVDDEIYLIAMEWYIVLMCIQKGYKHPIFDWKTAYTMFYGGTQLEPFGWRGKAQNSVRLPSIDSMERFTRMWEHRMRRDLPNQFFNQTEQPYGTIY